MHTYTSDHYKTYPSFSYTENGSRTPSTCKWCGYSIIGNYMYQPKQPNTKNGSQSLLSSCRNITPPQFDDAPRHYNKYTCNLNTWLTVSCSGKCLYSYVQQAINPQPPLWLPITHVKVSSVGAIYSVVQHGQVCISVLYSRLTFFCMLNFGSPLGMQKYFNTKTFPKLWHMYHQKM